MSTPFVVPADLHVNGNISGKTMTIPSGTVDNAAVKALAAIAASKVIHQHVVRHSQKNGTDVVTETIFLHLFRNTGVILALEVVPADVPAGGDKEVEVDLQIGDVGSAFSSVLAAPIVVDSASVNKTPQAGIISAPDAVDNDILQLVITASGASGTHCQGILIVVTFTETP